MPYPKMDGDDTPPSDTVRDHDMRTALIACSNATGHINSTLGLAERLRGAGYRVVYIGPEAMGAHVRRQGYEHQHVPHMELIPLPYGVRHRFPGSVRAWARGVRARRARAHREAAQFLAQAGWMLASTDALVDHFRPALLVLDPFMLPYYLPFHRHGIPAVAVSSKPALAPAAGIPPYDSALRGGAGPLDRARVRLAWAWRSARYRAWESYERVMSGYSLHELLARLGARCGFPLDAEWATRPLAIDLRFRSVPEVVLWPPGFELPGSGPLADGMAYVGACLPTRRADGDFPWHTLPAYDRLVVATKSTVTAQRGPAHELRHCDRVVEAVRSHPRWLLLIATGERVDPARYAGVANVRAVRRLPMLEVLPRADALVTQAGANSVREALAAGVPMLCYPRAQDQPGITARLVQHGVAIAGRPGDGPAEVGARLARLLDDERHRARAAALRTLFTGPDDFLAVVERLTAGAAGRL